MKLLAFDTSSKALSVAILEDETLLAETTLTIKKNHSITLMPVIDFLMQQIDLTPKDLDRIVVAEGPGLSLIHIFNKQAKSPFWRGFAGTPGEK